jgi:ATP-dependent DNA ligase
VAGHDTRQEPLRSRRALLEELAKDWEPPLDLSPATTDPAEAQTWFKELPATGVEGLILKKTAEPYAGGQRIWQKLKHRETVDVICGAVIGPIDRPETIVAGLPIDGQLRIVGRSAPLKTAAAKLLGAQLQPAGPGHPWPNRVKSTTLDRFNADKDETELTFVEPTVVEVSADTAMTGTSFRHTVRYLRARPELDPDDVSPPSSNPESG